MRLVGAGIAAALAASPGALAYPMDIEHHARWLVLDGLPRQGQQGDPGSAVAQLRTRDWETREIDIAAVCGTIDFKDPDDGATNFVVFYARDDRGVIGPVGRPIFYGTLAGDNPQQDAARTACGASQSAASEAPPSR